MTWRTWQDAWQEALYGEAGFYRRPEGPAGHFATSAQGVPGVGALLAAVIALLAEKHALTRVVDVGAGRGELLTSLHTVAPHLRLTGVDVVDRPAGLPTAVEWVRSPGGAGMPVDDWPQALVLAHELLDVVPCPVLEVDDHWVLREVEVDGSGTERLGDPAVPDDLAWARAHWAEFLAVTGGRVEVGRPRERVWEQLAMRCRGGLLVGVDYGHTATSRPAAGTLTGFRDGVEVRPRGDGTTDVTAHLAVDTLPCDRRARQADLFRELLPAAASPPPITLATTDPPAYLAALTAGSARGAATARPGLGDFWWLLRRC